MWPAVLDLLLPPACAACGARPAAGGFCRACAPWVEPIPARSCVRCAGPLPAPPEGDACPACVAAPPPFERLAAPYQHGGAVADAIHRLKYRGRREVAQVLGTLLVRRMSGLLEGADAVAPIPLHEARRRARGYDQAVLLARVVARRSRVRFRPELLRRTRETAGQVGLGREARLRNLEGAFVAGDGAASAVPRSIVLVDDVVTTAATASAAAAALRQAGARRVVVLAISRAG